MLPYFWYILKVIICSGILFGYYWLFLRNKVFHQYNRFYLLAALTLSLVLPLLKINFWQADEQQSDMIRVLQVVSAGDDYMNNVIVTADRGNWSIQQLYPLVYWMVSLIFLLVMLQTVFIIRSLLKKYPVQLIDNFAFINTNDKSTPFSFLKYIFWNEGIDLDTATGKQIFKHEVAHIQEKHTYDKLFINILLIFFWCNPFFWLYRKELNMIHEFIADKKAVEDSDTASFAAMILQAAYPQQQFQLTNNFFYSPIKRRLLMLTKNNDPRVNYLGRVMVLPLAILIFAAFSFKTKDPGKEDKSSSVLHTNNTEGLALHNDTIPFTVFVNTKHANADYLKSDECKTKALVIVDSKEIGNLGFNYVDNGSKKYSSVVIYDPAEAKKVYGEKGSHGVIKLTENDIIALRADSVIYNDENKSIRLSGSNISIKGGELSNTLIYVDGKLSSPEELNTIPPAKISSINVLKGDKLNDFDEAKGKTAIIYVSLKPDDLEEVVVTSSLHKKEATPFISLDKFSVLYIGLDNPVTITAPVIPGDQLFVNMNTNNATISGRNGKYIVHVTAVGEATIEVWIKNDQRVILSTKTFQVKRVPDPTDPDFPDELKRIYKLDSSYKLQSDNNQKLMEEQKYLSNLDQTQSEVRALTAASDAEKTVIEKKIQGQQLQLLKQKIILDEQNKTNRTLNKIQLEVNEKDLVAEKAMTERKLTDQELHYLKQKIILDEQNKTIPWTTHLNLQKIQFDQKEYLVQQDNQVFTKTEVGPQFTGGEEAWKNYLRANLNNNTPVDNRAPAGKYTVVLKFIVRTDGSISDITCENDPGYGTCAEALRVIKNTPKWQPGIQNGRKVNAYKRQPITFIIKE